MFQANKVDPYPPGNDNGSGPPPAYGFAQPPGYDAAYPPLPTQPQYVSYTSASGQTAYTTGGKITIGYNAPSPMVIQREPKPQNYMLFSLIVFGCFNPLFGLLAICLSMSSNNAYERGNIEEAKKQGLLARNVGVVAIIFGVISMVVFIAVYINLVVLRAHVETNKYHFDW